jgi:hypothetical protein
LSKYSILQESRGGSRFSCVLGFRISALRDSFDGRFAVGGKP